MTQTLTIDPSARGLIFDLDGTLIDSLELNWQAMNRALRQYDIAIERQEFIDLTGRSLQEIVAIILERHGGAASLATDIVRRKQAWANDHASEIRPFAAVEAVARQAHGRLPLCVGTGSDRDRAMLMLQATNLLPLFDHIVAADDVEHHKPAPDTFLRCAELMGLPPQDCQVFEDGIMGLAAARAAGMIVTDVRPFLF